MTTVLEYAAPAVDRREILRYAGVRGKAAEIEELLEECLAELLDKLVYRVCYRRLSREAAGELIGDSVTAEGFLAGYDQVLVFGATVGLAPDRLMLKYGNVAPTKALLMQAIGAERIEALCDSFCEDLATHPGTTVGRRFSPGYGDLPLECQTRIFALLDCPKAIGLTLNESLLMSPTKSVTAMMGVRDGAPKDNGRRL